MQLDTAKATEFGATIEFVNDYGDVCEGEFSHVHPDGSYVILLTAGSLDYTTDDDLEKITYHT